MVMNISNYSYSYWLPGFTRAQFVSINYNTVIIISPCHIPSIGWHMAISVISRHGLWPLPFVAVLFVTVQSVAIMACYQSNLY